MIGNIGIFILKIILIIILIIIIILLLRQNNAVNHEIRISKYSIDSKKKKEISILDKLLNKFLKFIKSKRKLIKKLFPFLTDKYSKKNYIYNSKELKGEDIVFTKIIISIVFVLLAILSSILKSRFASFIQISFAAVIGFFAIDIYAYFYQKNRIKRIENDMLRAVIIMNNAFKSGKSITQALEITSNEIRGPLSEEFKKIYHDMSYGLSVDKAFERFAKRVNLEEAYYISSSLTILNKTGGNIIKVFSSIERTLFDRKKLKEELEKLTASSNLVVKILIIIPFLFIGVIYLLSPTYFEPFFSSTLGFILLAIIVIIFVLYVYFLEKIVKVKV